MPAQAVRPAHSGGFTEDKPQAQHLHWHQLSARAVGARSTPTRSAWARYASHMGPITHTASIASPSSATGKPGQENKERGQAPAECVCRLWGKGHPSRPTGTRGVAALSQSSAQTSQQPSPHHHPQVHHRPPAQAARLELQDDGPSAEQVALGEPAPRVGKRAQHIPRQDSAIEEPPDSFWKRVMFSSIRG